jgi:hypothetical protein
MRQPLQFQLSSPAQNRRASARSPNTQLPVRA